MAIEVTGIDLVKFAQKVYELSVPQGMGFLHYTPEPLDESEAKQLVRPDDRYTVLNMDYVRGRACKMHVYVNGGKWFIDDSWYDHTDRVYEKLLSEFGIKRTPEECEHGVACNCIDCQDARAI